MQGVAMGGSVAGPYGAGGGLIIGLLTGLLTADSYYEQLNGQILAEQAKDRDLEAQLDKELERQRELEAQLEQPGALREDPEGEHAGSGGETTRKAEKPERSPKADETLIRDQEGIGPLASLKKGKASPQPPTSAFRGVKVRDVNGDGVPDLWIYFDPVNREEIVRQEEDSNWDGRVDTWSTFTDGKLVRREVDANGDGRGDRFFFYEDESLVREERHERGQSHPSYRALYHNGRLANVEKDLDRDGRMDLWITYDKEQPEEVMIREERDINGDGAVDFWSYYQNGRLVRRDVSEVGLKHLSEREKLPPGAPMEALPTS